MESRTLVFLLAVTLASALAVRLARRIALKKALLDHPNERSSHRQPVPRLGGASFMPIVLAGVVAGWMDSGLPNVIRVAFLAGAAALFGISLLDDFRSLPTTVRLTVQFAAALGLLGAIAVSGEGPPSGSEFRVLGSELRKARQSEGDGPAVATNVNSQALPQPSKPPPRSLAPSFPHSLVPPLSPPLLLSLSLSFLILWIVGLLNVYNFMDGIDGIAGIQAVVAGATWWAIAGLAGAPQSGLLAACAAAGALGFLTLNWPPAKIFMGDAGSTVLGYMFAVLPLLVVVEGKAGHALVRYMNAAVLAVWPFLADGTFTIFRRLKNRENIFQAHRSHLYQRLVIAGVSHQTVTSVYGLLAVVGGVLAWFVVKSAPLAIPIAVGVVVVAFVLLWGWVLRTERAALRAAVIG